MTGALMQIVAYGSQDVFLTGQPEITFFKEMHKRHTNFAVESIQQTFSGTADFGKRVTALISRSGDLLHRLTLEVDLPQLAVTSGNVRWVDDPGHHLIKEYEVEIGGQSVDKQTGQWLQIINDLTQEAGKARGYKQMIGHEDPFDAVNQDQGPARLQAWSSNTKPSKVCYVPLQFWFCRNIGLSLPLIALQYHEVKVTVVFRAAEEMYISSSAQALSLSLPRVALYGDYVYLETDERRRFAQISHEYLIEQVQHTGSESMSSSENKVKLSMNHPVKSLIWVVQNDEMVAAPDSSNSYVGNQHSNFSDTLADNDEDHTCPVSSQNPVTMAKVLLNGQDRFSMRQGSYFNLVQPYYHHSNIPRSPGVNVYSFAYQPEQHQPSSAVNMSRIDNAVLHVRLSWNGALATDCKIYVYAVNYNILRVMSGMAGLAYAN